MSRTEDAESHPSLSKARVLQAAVELADREGLATVSMRKLADQLGAGAMSLYHYFVSKNALLDEMVDAVFAEIEPPSTELDWKQALRARALSTRAALRRHPWALDVMETRMQPGPANLRLHDAVLACLREAGFSVPDAVHAYSVQDAYIYGFALQEKNLPFSTSEEAAQVGEAMIRQFQPLAETLPYSYEVVGGYIAKGGYDPTAEFLFGLDLILNALEPLLEEESNELARESASRASPSPSSRRQ